MKSLLVGLGIEISAVCRQRSLWGNYTEIAIEYTTHYNLQETSGRHDMTGLPINSLGEYVELSANNEKMISISAEAGVNFCTLIE